jgi:hypothetical protein
MTVVRSLTISRRSAIDLRKVPAAGEAVNDHHIGRRMFGEVFRYALCAVFTATSLSSGAGGWRFK